MVIYGDNYDLEPDSPTFKGQTADQVFAKSEAEKIKNKMKVVFETGIAGLHKLKKITVVGYQGIVKGYGEKIVFREAFQWVNNHWESAGCRWYGNGDGRVDNIGLFEEHLKESEEYKKKEYEIDEIKEERMSGTENMEGKALILVDCYSKGKWVFQFCLREGNEK